MTFLEMQTAVGEDINQSLTDDTKTVTLTSVKRNLNTGYRKARLAVTSIWEDYYLRKASADLEAEQALYSLPTDFLKMKTLEVAYDGSTFYQAKRLDKGHKQDLRYQFSQSAPTFSIIGNDLQLDPIPNGDATGGLVMYYIENSDDMSANGAEPNLPPGFEDVPIMYAVSKAKLALGLVSEANTHLQEFNYELDQMKRWALNRRGADNDMVKFVDQY